MRGHCDHCGNAESNHRMIGGHDYTEKKETSVGHLSGVVDGINTGDFVKFGGGIYHYDGPDESSEPHKLIFTFVKEA